MMFYEQDNCIRLSRWVDDYGTESGIFLFKNMIPEELLVSVETKLDKQVSGDFEYSDGLMSWYVDKVSLPVDGTHKIWEIISELIGPTWVIHPQNNVLILKPGQNGMFTHSDSPGKYQCHLLSQVDFWSTCCLLDYGVVAYLGNWEGGEVFYPNINKDGSIKEDGQQSEDCFEYKPERGDILIHSAFHPYEHGVRDVKSGLRYAFSNFSLKAEDNPGTFHNYGTKEYIEQIKDKSFYNVMAWTNKIKENPHFTKDKLKEMQDSGLEGKELSYKYFAALANDGVCACGIIHEKK
jgi:hypothetical protein